ncbi:hypothetical protein B0H11DRAFT_820146 [Mycena galericulata]|nr:hypothetical protein B0H11DRAFT_820146 [Mycena galericulata]
MYLESLRCAAYARDACPAPRGRVNGLGVHPAVDDTAPWVMRARGLACGGRRARGYERGCTRGRGAHVPRRRSRSQRARAADSSASTRGTPRKSGLRSSASAKRPLRAVDGRPRAPRHVASTPGPSIDSPPSAVYILLHVPRVPALRCATLAAYARDACPAPRGRVNGLGVHPAVDDTAPWVKRARGLACRGRRARGYERGCTRGRGAHVPRR